MKRGGLQPGELGEQLKLYVYCGSTAKQYVPRNNGEKSVDMFPFHPWFTRVVLLTCLQACVAWAGALVTYDVTEKREGEVSRIEEHIK